MSRGFQKNEAGEWEPFDDDFDGFDGSPEGNNIAALEAEVAQLRAALTQFVAACETAPPTSLMIEIGIACKVAKTALALRQGHQP